MPSATLTARLVSKVLRADRLRERAATYRSLLAMAVTAWAAMSSAAAAASASIARAK
jgi:hypothetical protein